MSQLALALNPPAQFDAPLPGPVGSALRHTFDCMAIAEEELAAAGRAGGGWSALVPTEPLRRRALWLYRAHVRELLARIDRGQDLEPATEAELLSVMLITATVAPLTSEALPVAEWLWERVAPPETHAKVLGHRAREKWAGQVAETVAMLRRKYRQDRGAP